MYTVQVLSEGQSTKESKPNQPEKNWIHRKERRTLHSLRICTIWKEKEKTQAQITTSTNRVHCDDWFILMQKCIKTLKWSRIKWTPPPPLCILLESVHQEKILFFPFWGTLSFSFHHNKDLFWNGKIWIIMRFFEYKITRLDSNMHFVWMKFAVKTNKNYTFVINRNH